MAGARIRECVVCVRILVCCVCVLRVLCMCVCVYAWHIIEIDLLRGAGLLHFAEKCVVMNIQNSSNDTPVDTTPSMGLTNIQTGLKDLR